MEEAMATMFPKGIRALMVDDDNRFVRSSTSLLSVLNFDVVSCSTVVHALKSLSTLNLKGIDVVLVHAAKAASCGFNFRAIIETDLGIPVIYFLPLDHRATGDEAAELLRTLEAGTYIMTKPLDVDEVRSRLWRVIAWRKCALQRMAAASDGSLEGEDDKGRVHYKVVRIGRRGQKRKEGSSAGGGSPSTGAGAGAGDGGGRHPEPAGKGKEKVNDGNDYQQQPAQQKKRRGRKPKKTTGEASKPFQFKQPSKVAMSGGQPPVRRQPPRPSLFVESVLRTLKVPPHNAKFFSDDAGPSNIAAAAPPLPPPALPPAARNLVFGNIAPPVAAATGTVPAGADEPRGIGNQQQQPAVNKVVIGNMAPPPPPPLPAAATTMDAAATGTYKLQDARPLLMFGAFGPFPYQGPQPHVATPAPAGRVSTGGAMVAEGGSSAGASASTGAGTYCNDEDSSFLQSLNLAGGQAAGDMDVHTSWADPAELVVVNASDEDEEAMLEALFDDINNHGASGSPLVVATDDQVLAMASNVIVNDPATMAASGAFGTGSSDATAASSFMAPHLDLIGATPNGGNKYAAANGDQLELDSNMQGDDDTLFPLDALLEGVSSPLLVADQDGGGAGGAAGEDTTLIGGKEDEGGDMNDLEGLNGLEIPHDVFQLDEFLFPHHQDRNKKNKNNDRE